jgi:hypothetical protein
MKGFRALQPVSDGLGGVWGGPPSMCQPYSVNASAHDTDQGQCLPLDHSRLKPHVNCQRRLLRKGKKV